MREDMNIMLQIEEPDGKGRAERDRQSGDNVSQKKAGNHLFSVTSVGFLFLFFIT